MTDKLEGLFCSHCFAQIEVIDLDLVGPEDDKEVHQGLFCSRSCLNSHTGVTNVAD
jgi:hypothetical protein